MHRSRAARPEFVSERYDSLVAGDDLPVERYRWAADHLKGKNVVDACCGTGYGAGILRGIGERTVLGIDIDRAAIEYAVEHYPGSYVIANAEIQTFAGFDAVVCLEGISHMVDPYSWIKNLAVPELVVSAPLTPSKHWNPWRKHDIPPSDLIEMFVPRWRLKDQLQQRRSTTTSEYLTLYLSNLED